MFWYSLLNCYPNYSTPRLYFKEVKTPYWKPSPSKKNNRYSSRVNIIFLREAFILFPTFPFCRYLRLSSSIPTFFFNGGGIARFLNKSTVGFDIINQQRIKSETWNKSLLSTVEYRIKHVVDFWNRLTLTIVY